MRTLLSRTKKVHTQHTLFNISIRVVTTQSILLLYKWLKYCYFYASFPFCRFNVMMLNSSSFNGLIIPIHASFYLRIYIFVLVEGIPHQRLFCMIVFCWCCGYTMAEFWIRIYFQIDHINILLEIKLSSTSANAWRASSWII